MQMAKKKMKSEKSDNMDMGLVVCTFSLLISSVL